MRSVVSVHPLILAAVFALVTACGDQHAEGSVSTAKLNEPTLGELSGDVFVVTRAQQNIKLALVTVQAIPEQEIAAVLGPHIAEAKDRIAQLSRDVQIAESQMRAANAESSTALRAADRYFKNCEAEQDQRDRVEMRERGMSWNELQQERRDKPVSIRYCEAERNRLLKQSNSDPGRAKDNYKRLLEEYELARTGESVFMLLPEPGVSAKTNADGHFSMQIPREGRFALSATASRQVGSETEEYRWLVWVSLEGADRKHVMLANDNLVTSGSPDSVLTVPL